jgi:hypothetical protein
MALNKAYNELGMDEGDLRLEAGQSISSDNGTTVSFEKQTLFGRPVTSLRISHNAGFTRYRKRSSIVGENPPPAVGNTAFFYCESGEAVCGDQTGNLTQLS